MDIEIVNVNSHGSGYAVVHNDDGSTYGLQFNRAPVNSPDELIRYLSEKAQTIEQERLAATVEAPPLPSSVRNLLHKRTPIVARNQES